MAVDILAGCSLSQPDLCRCCLSTSGKFDLTAPVLTEVGVLEIFADMLFECYGIKLSLLSKWGLSRYMCSTCVKHLRDASTFKKQILDADRRFSVYFSSKDTTMVDVENASENLTDDHDTCAEEAQINEDVNQVIPDQRCMKNTLLPSKLNKGKKCTSKVKPRRLDDPDDLEADIPLSELKKCVEIQNNVELKEENIKYCIIKTDIVKRAPPQHKQLSERKRIITTCETILKDTTACPFRHHKSWFQCFFCTQDFMEINTLRQHTLTAHKNINEEIKNIKRFPRSLQIEISDLKCRHCDTTLTDVSSLRGHFVDVHKKVIYKEFVADYKVDSSPYACHLCKQQFHVFRTLTMHLNEHYANCICDVCGKSFLNSKRLKVHARTHENGSYPCKKCGKVLKTKSSEANHMESAHSKRVIKCQICLKPMKHYNERVKHMSDVHNITHKFVCPVCSREYNIKHYLATHMRQTHGHKNKKCLECGMAFNTNHGLKKHMLRHSGVKAYSCEVCSKTYARSYTLKEHMKGHNTGEFGAS